MDFRTRETLFSFPIVHQPALATGYPSHCLNMMHDAILRTRYMRANTLELIATSQAKVIMIVSDRDLHVWNDWDILLTTVLG